MNLLGNLPAPLRTNDFYVLLALLRQQPRHAYGIKSDIRKISFDSVNISDGTVHSILMRLCEEGEIIPLGEGPVGDSGNIRRLYGISEMGKIRLQEEAKRLKHAVEIIEHTGILENKYDPDIQRIMLQSQLDSLTDV